jgi:hypothetical protein
VGIRVSALLALYCSANRRSLPGFDEYAVARCWPTLHVYAGRFFAPVEKSFCRAPLASHFMRMNCLYNTQGVIILFLPNLPGSLPWCAMEQKMAFLLAA